MNFKVHYSNFDVDGDIVTLRDYATSAEHKRFLFRINDDKMELPFSRFEDGALFSTEFHHDISEYWKSGPEQDKGDLLPPVAMVDGYEKISSGGVNRIGSPILEELEELGCQVELHKAWLDCAEG